MSEEAGAPKQLSKNELKKQAKKAEKAAKKAGASSSEPAAPTPAGAAAPAPSAPPTSSSSAMGSGKIVIQNLQSDAASTKVVWTTMTYDVDIDVESGGKGKKPVLVVQGQEISGGGNAMSLALAVLSGKQELSVSEQLLQDDWCEWERSVLRAAGKGDKKKLSVALEYLNAALTKSGGVHLAGSSLSVADICVLTTLNTSGLENLPTAVQRYVSVHAETWARVKETVEEYVQQSSALPPLELNMSEPSLLKLVDSLFRQVIQGVFGLAASDLPTTIVTRCSNPKHGDYQCSAAMPVFAALKKANNLPDGAPSPPKLAELLIESIKATNNPVITDLQMNGPGFIVCKIQASLLQNHVAKFLETQKLPIPAMPSQVCVVDFSSPNIAKEMHVGHLRSTIIGESVCRILELVGHKVHRTNHVGDWGTQFGMLIQYLREEYPSIQSDDASSELPNITDLTEFYKNAKKRFDESPEFKKQSQLNVVQLQSGDPDCKRIWQLLCDVSRKEFEKVYRRLDVTLEEVGESFYNSMIPPAIEKFQKAGLLTSEEGGAKVVFLGKEFVIPLMLQKSDGGFGYDSTDIAALHYRLHTLKADRIIIITDFSQGDHFKMIFKAGENIGWVDRGQRLQHIGFGTVQGEDGKRFKTRSGDTVRLVDLLDEAALRMKESLQERLKEGKANITENEIEEVAEAIGYGSVKYFDLRRNPTSNYKFSYDKMLDTKGDTGVYLLYARVRLESILAKAKEVHSVDIEQLMGEIKSKGSSVLDIAHASERNLALQLQQFPDIITLTLDDLYPYHICEYVYKLAIAASDFVTQCKVLGSPEMKPRLLLCQATVMAMKQAFDLLGIRHVKRI